VSAYNANQFMHLVALAVAGHLLKVGITSMNADELNNLVEQANTQAK